MATNERIVLDPPELITGRSSFEITNFIDQEGADWGEAAIEAVFADKDRGSVPVDFRVGNREVTIPMGLVNRGTVTALEARAALQAKVALFQKEGGWLKRITNQGGTVYADIVDASLSVGSPAGFESKQDIDLDASLQLTLLPDFYQDEITLADHTETTLPEITFTESSVFGDYPARVRIMVDEDDGEDQRGLLWGFRSRYYASANTAALAYQAESLQALDIAALRSLSGASGGTVVRHGTISTNWTPVLGTNKGGTAYLTHQGTYRLWARVYSTSGTTVQARAVYDVGDLVNPVENDAWRLPGASNFYVHDFGEVRLDASPVGAHRWQGQIQAKGDVGNENFSVDRIWFQPVDEGAGKLTAGMPIIDGLSSYAARSEFKTESGTITGDALRTGGNWTYFGGTSLADFSASPTAGTAARTATWEAGRWLSAGATNYTNISAQVDFSWSTWSGTAALRTVQSGLFARGASPTTCFEVEVYQTTSPSQAILAAYLSGTTLAVKPVSIATGAAGGAATSYTLKETIYNTGFWQVSVQHAGAGAILASASGYHSDLATGGLRATGKIGIMDWSTSSKASTRTYRNFAAWVPTTDAVNFANRSVQLTTDGAYRLDSGGTAYGPVSIQSGDLPRLPVSGLEGRTTEVFLKPSRGDFDQLPDSGIDDVSARVYYRPSYLTLGTI